MVFDIAVPASAANIGALDIVEWSVMLVGVNLELLDRAAADFELK
ncbi:hypothetical protein ACF07D_00245 [Leucobacter sp. NPDC015123]